MSDLSISYLREFDFSEALAFGLRQGLLVSDIHPPGLDSSGIQYTLSKSSKSVTTSQGKDLLYSIWFRILLSIIEPPYGKTGFVKTPRHQALPTGDSNLRVVDACRSAARRRSLRPLRFVGDYDCRTHTTMEISFSLSGSPGQACMQSLAVRLIGAGTRRPTTKSRCATDTLCTSCDGQYDIARRAPSGHR